MESKRQDDRQQCEDRNDAEVEPPQFLFIDLTGEQRQLCPVLQMSIHCIAAAKGCGQQMRRIRWSNALGNEMPPDVQIGGIFSLLDCLMVCACFADCFLLGTDVIV